MKNDGQRRYGEVMQLTMIGGGGFRVPQMFRALAEDPEHLIDRLVLVDNDPHRLAVIESVIHAMPLDGGTPPELVTTTDWRDGIPGADFVFTTIRVGGTEARALDEEIALSHGLLGQETVGVGGISYALRTIPVARDLTRTITELAPNAWIINFTNPVGAVTQAMREESDRVVGICDTPIGLVNHIADVTHATPTRFEYAGLNHLGWLRAVEGTPISDGKPASAPSRTAKSTKSAVARESRDLLGTVLADDALLNQLEETAILGPDLTRSIGAIPNEYLFYYVNHREALARISTRIPRGRQLARQQRAFYDAASADPSSAYDLWAETLREREETYGAETRDDANVLRDAHSIELGGYQKVAVELMRVLAGVDTPRQMILNVPNHSPLTRGPLITQLAPDAVVEISCDVDTNGVHPHLPEPLPSDLAGLMVQVKGSDELILEATRMRDPMLAVRALASHPLVDSLPTAFILLAEYCERIPSVALAIGASNAQP